MAILNNNFYGEIEGRNVYSFLGELDYDLTTSTDRINHLKKILQTENGYPHPFFERIFEQTHDEDTGLNSSYIKLVLNTTDELYTNSNVCDVLRKMADYVLFTKEGRELNRSNLTQYKIYKDARLFEKIQKELSLEAELERVAGSSEEEGDIDTLIHILVKDANHRKDKSTRITADDFNDPELGPIIKGYQNQINYMRNKLEKNKEIIYLVENFNTLTAEQQERLQQLQPNLQQCHDLRDRKVELIRESKTLSKHIHSMRQDMLDCKDMIKRPIVFKSLLDGHPEPDFSPLDALFNFEELDIVAFREKAMEYMEFYKEKMEHYEDLYTRRKEEETSYSSYKEKYMFFKGLYDEMAKIVYADDKKLYSIRNKQRVNAAKELLSIKEEEVYDLQDDFEVYKFMIKQSKDMVNLTQIERRIIELTQSGYKQDSIATVINEEYPEASYTQQKVSENIWDIAQRVVDHLQSNSKQFKILRGEIRMQTKICEACKTEKEVTQFHRDSKSSDGYRAKCKECRKSK